MLGQSKSVQAGRDSTRPAKADRLPAVQRALRPADPGRGSPVPAPANGIGWKYRPLGRPSRHRDHAVSTSPRSPATCPPRPPLMGNTVGVGSRHRPSNSRHTTPCGCSKRAGLPPGVINLVTGDGTAVERGRPCPTRNFAGLHFTGSTRERSSTCGGGSRRTWTTTGPIRGSSARPAGQRTSCWAHPVRRAGVGWPPPLVRGRVRVPGPEVLRRVPRLPAAVAVGRAGLRDQLVAPWPRGLTYGDVGRLRETSAAPWIDLPRVSPGTANCSKRCAQ